MSELTSFACNRISLLRNDFLDKKNRLVRFVITNDAAMAADGDITLLAEVRQRQ